ncbi:LysE family translocator [Sphaerimonospora cavernae]|uniref:LysE family translocator n=1 Tax=Sphaerimonospora cavernae TaxID=1740611 RepID=A0ABV6TZV3_9ACTN
MISALFLASSVLVIVTPGPDAALIARLVLGGMGRARGLTAAAGMITAGGVQAMMSVLGVSLLLTADSTLFRAVQWVGAALLFYWGLRALLAALRRPRPGPADGNEGVPAVPKPPTGRRTFLQGLLCTGTNPKVGLFLLAFLPQFVPAGEPPGRSMALLAAVYLALGALWLTILTELLVRLRQLTDRRRPSGGQQLLRWVDAGLGLVFVGFAVRLVVGG